MSLKSTAAFTVLSSAALCASYPPVALAGNDPVRTHPPVEWQTINHHKNNTIRVAGDIDFSHYKQIHIAASVYAPQNPREHLKPWQAQQTLATVDDSLQKMFRAGDESSASLEIRPVVTGVKLLHPVVNVFSFVTIQAIVSYGAASIRYELWDTTTGKQVGEVLIDRHGRPWNVPLWHFLQNFEPLGHSSLLLASDAKKLRKDLVRLADGMVQPKALTPTQGE